MDGWMDGLTCTWHLSDFLVPEACITSVENGMSNFLESSLDFDI